MTGTPAIVATDVSRTYELDGVSVPALRGVSVAARPDWKTGGPGRITRVAYRQMRSVAVTFVVVVFVRPPAVTTSRIRMPFAS